MPGHQIWMECISNLLLFSLVFGMSATVDLQHMQRQLRNRAALLIGMGLQFVLLPFVGFCVVKLLLTTGNNSNNSNPNTTAVGIMVLVITSSPGGTFSNWWCSLFNADLALSVTMTAVSTTLSTLLLPLNVFLYAKLAYSAKIVQELDWTALYVSIAVVIGGIGSGLIVSSRTELGVQSIRLRRRANRLGSAAGLILIVVSILIHQKHTAGGGDDEDRPTAVLLDQDWTFYLAVALPPIIGMATAFFLANACQLPRPECLAVAIESCNQNTGIATTVALSLFTTGDELRTAMGVPLSYGVISMLMNFTVCVVCWKRGWTKAPASDPVCKVLMTSYEVNEQEASREHEEAIEVVMSTKDGGKQMIFAHSAGGDYIVDESTLRQFSNCQHCLEWGEDLPTELPSDGSEDDDEGENSIIQEAGAAQQLEDGRGKRRLLGRTISKIRARTAGYRLPPAEEASEFVVTADTPSPEHPQHQQPRPIVASSPYISVATHDSPEQHQPAYASIGSIKVDEGATEHQRRPPFAPGLPEPRRLASYATVPTEQVVPQAPSITKDEMDDDDMSL